MRTSLLVLICLGAVVTLAPAQDEPKSSGPPPRFVTVSAIDTAKGVLDLTETVTKLVPETRTKVVIKDGVEQMITYTVLRPVFEMRVLKHALNSGEAFDVSGKKLTDAEVAKRLRIGGAALLSADGKKVDAAYLNLLKKDAVILTFPSSSSVLPPPKIENGGKEIPKQT